MKRSTLLLLGLSAAAATIYFLRQDRKQAQPRTRPEQEPTQPDQPRADAALPDGFPQLTPPGQITVKRYPDYRAARLVKENENFNSAMDDAFFPLLHHIEDRQVEMTAPVITHFPMTVATENRGHTVVEFVYPSREVGKIEHAADGVAVADIPAGTYATIGVRGKYTTDNLRTALRQLEHWLAQYPEYKLQGPPRALYYNNPTNTPPDGLFSEVQVPVQYVGPTGETKTR